MSTFQAMQAQERFEPQLLSKKNVVGVAVGFKESKGEKSGDLSVVVLVQQKQPLAALAVEDVIPSELDGMRTDVYEVGFLKAQLDPTQRIRPMPCGVSIGHYKITAGTFGVLVTDKTSGDRLILSNNHVLANSNLGQKGDAILQPGPIDGGQNPGDIVATLERFVTIHYTDDVITPEPPPTPDPGPTPNPNPNPTPNPGGTTGCDVVSSFVTVANALATLLGSQKRVTTTTLESLAASQTIGSPTPVASTVSASATVPENRVDCALARPSDLSQFTGEIVSIGSVSGTKTATLGMRVRKYGRTTQYTEGNVTLLNATVNIAYGAKTARFVGQVVTEAMSQGGDSGSLIVDATENRAVGLLFAGSDLATIFNPIDAVLERTQRDVVVENSERLQPHPQPLSTLWRGALRAKRSFASQRGEVKAAVG